MAVRRRSWGARERGPRAAGTAVSRPAPAGIQDFAAGFIDRVPNLIAAVGCLPLAIVAAGTVKRAVEAALRRSPTETHLRVLAGKLAHLGVMVAGIVVALAIAGANRTALVASGSSRSPSRSGCRMSSATPPPASCCYC